jgi:alkylation response protein AidB-like acyl-CoA dehydrogenase
VDFLAERPEWPLADPEMFRRALQEWLAANWSPFITLRQWWQRMADAGLTVPTWPRLYGGLSSVAGLQQIIEEELGVVGAIAAPLWGDGLRVAGPALREHATQAQLARYLPTLLNGTEPWSVLFAEAEDDDLTAVSTIAAADWRSWTVRGMKWSRQATAARWGLLLAHTEPDTPGRDGMTCLAVDLYHESVFVNPSNGLIRFVDTPVELEAVIGQRGGGWSIVKTAMPYVTRSLAGRMRRGLVNVAPGERAGNLDRTVAQLTAVAPKPSAPNAERRTR